MRNLIHRQRSEEQLSASDGTCTKLLRCIGPHGDVSNRSKTAVTWGCVRAFQQVSSTPMNGLKLTLVSFKIWLCATEAWQCMARGPTPPSLEPRACGLSIGLRRRSDGLKAPSTTLRTDARQHGCNGRCAWDRDDLGSPAWCADRCPGRPGSSRRSGAACAARRAGLRGSA